jgi:ParB family chromosome partitioning protein
MSKLTRMRGEGQLRPIERARALRSLMDRNGWSTSRVAAELNMSQPAVVRALRLLTLPEEVQALVEHGSLSPAAADEVSKLPSPEAQELAAEVVREGLTVLQTVERVKQRKGGTALLTTTFKHGGVKVTVRAPFAGPEAIEPGIQVLERVRDLEAAPRGIDRPAIK